MLVEKEIIRPGTYWYRDESTGLPRKLVVTPELTKYWHEQGSAMLSAGLTVPVPCEHDFTAHPMTPADKLKNNAGWVKEYRLKGDKGDRLFGVVDVPDPEIAKKLPHTIRWTSPWINSFTDGTGKTWNNVISHLALTTRPRIINQQPFGSIAAALSMATGVGWSTGSFKDSLNVEHATDKGFCLSRAGRLFTDKKSKRLRPRYPMAFSLWGGGIKLAEDDAPPEKGDLPDDDADLGDEDFDIGADDDMDMDDIMDPLADANGDVKMEELLCDLLQALGVPMPDESNEQEFKRHLYEAAMSKIKELTSKGMGKQDEFTPDQNQPPNQQPNASQPNPLIQQEQQPMYMSLEEIEKTITDPTMKKVALSMYAENQKIRSEMEAAKKVTDSLRDAKLKEATAARATRVTLLGKLSPKVKADLDAMLALPAMALSMGEGGVVVDPMAQTLAVLEKGLADLPKLLTTDQTALSVQAHPVDQSEMTEEKSDEIADGLARQMGAPAKRAS